MCVNISINLKIFGSYSKKRNNNEKDEIATLNKCKKKSINR